MIAMAHRSIAAWLRKAWLAAKNGGAVRAA